MSCTLTVTLPADIANDPGFVPFDRFTHIGYGAMDEVTEIVMQNVETSFPYKTVAENNGHPIASPVYVVASSSCFGDANPIMNVVLVGRTTSYAIRTPIIEFRDTITMKTYPGHNMYEVL